MNTAMLEKLIRFQHPEKVLGYLGGLDDTRVAALFGLEVDAYLRIRHDHEDQVRRTAEELLGDPAFAEKVDRLPFAPGLRVVAVGESTTDDLLSWFEILRHLLALRRPGDGIVLVNTAVSGQTSTQALAGSPAVAFQRPDWVLCMLGANDVRRFGGPEGPILVSPDETGRTLGALRDIVTARTGARWVWVAPSPIDDARVAAYQPFLQGGFSWSDRDLDPVGAFLAAQPEPVVGSGPAVAKEGAQAHLDDGVHLSLAGQRALAVAVVETLADLT
ncbi:SGNH/GDSL hydrolase family protein [Streptosporangium sp. NPDC001559]|uniref:SGNH/GDSL hydrolase family protein n=1 Tax=Streptosporangium sp. NPDC001559 TaxID=3366187 RepID=UPI0036EEE049